MASGLEGRKPGQPELACVSAGKRMLRAALCVQFQLQIFHSVFTKGRRQSDFVWGI